MKSRFVLTLIGVMSVCMSAQAGHNDDRCIRITRTVDRVVEHRTSGGNSHTKIRERIVEVIDDRPCRQVQRWGRYNFNRRPVSVLRLGSRVDRLR